MKAFRGTSILILLLVAASCSRDQPSPPAKPARATQTQTKAEIRPAQTKADTETTLPATGEVPLYSRSRTIMSTIFRVTIAGGTDARAGELADAVFAEIERLEGVLSEWRPTSEISRINAAAGEQPVQVGRDTMAVVRAGQDVSRWSDGASDLSWAALRGMYLFQPGEERIPTAAEIRSRIGLVNWRDIILDPQAQTIFLRRKGMVIGTGSVAKGYALDQGASILDRAGVRNYMLFAGGQVLVKGKRGDRPWRVGIQHPRANDYIGYLEATEGSIATSGDYERYFVDAHGKRWHHIIDPRTGYPVQHTMSVTLRAATGLLADAIDTAVFVLGARRGLEMLGRISGVPDAVIIDKDARVHMTPGTRERLHMKIQLDNDHLPR